MRNVIRREDALKEISELKSNLKTLSEEDLRRDGFEGGSYDALVFDYVQYEYASATNEILAEMYELITDQRVVVIGKPQPLFKCKCCGYKTITEFDNYDICRWCGWEDDGRIDGDTVASPNNNSMKEVRRELDETGRLHPFHRWLR